MRTGYERKGGGVHFMRTGYGSRAKYGEPYSQRNGDDEMGWEVYFTRSG